MPRPAIILMGLRGSGKTTLGSQLAARLNIPFVDLDDRTRAALACDTTALAWKTHGEHAFRAAEVRALREALAHPGVLALGGGTPTAPGGADLLAESGVPIVYLHAPPDSLADRLRRTGVGDRPSLTGADPLDEFAAVYAKRDSLYRRLATHVIEVAGLPIDLATESLVRLI